MAAESQSVLIAAIVPIFVAALALASFANGFWMVRLLSVIFCINLTLFLSAYKGTLSKQLLFPVSGITGRTGSYVCLHFIDHTPLM